MIVNSHMKGTTLVCDYSEGEIEFEEIGRVKVGCKKTPIKGSYYCIDHQFSTIPTEQVMIIKIVIIYFGKLTRIMTANIINILVFFLFFRVVW